MRFGPSGFWDHFCTTFGFGASGRRRRPRRIASNSDLPVSAEIQELESRALLTVTYHGGALLTSVEAQAVYLGSDWQSSSALQTQTTSLNQFVSMIVQSGYMDMLTQAGYNVGRGSATAGVVDNITLNKTNTGITDGQIQADLQAMINAHQLQAPDANRLYVVYVEPGVIVRSGSDASNTTFLGYHSAFGGTTASGQPIDIHYAVIPHPGAPNFTASSQGFASDLDEMTSVSSHEIAEAATDPNVNYKALGWYDDQRNGEIGDLTNLNTVLNGFLVQDVVNQNDQVITPVTAPPALTAPQNVTVKALSTSTAQLSWSAVAGATGYRIFLVNGSQSTLLGSVGSSATSVQVNSLTPGSTVSFKVEAFNATATADSKLVSVTMPTTTPSTLAAPQVTARALSPTKALLTWNAVSGAQGYRVYQLLGTQRVLLGTVGPQTTQVQIYNLMRGSTARFVVEAFNASAVADSGVVSVSLPRFASSHNRWKWL